MVNLYQQRLKQLGVDDPNVNSTRLKDQLLSEIPELEAHKKGRDVLLAYTEDVGSVLSTPVDYTEAIIITKAAKILRQRMIDHKSVFAGTFDDNCVEDSIPPVLFQFVSMLEHGTDIKSQLQFGASKTDFALSQLLQCNCYANIKMEENCYNILKIVKLHFRYFLDCQYTRRPGRNTLSNCYMNTALAFLMTEFWKFLLS